MQKFKQKTNARLRRAKSALAWLTVILVKNPIVYVNRRFFLFHTHPPFGIARLPVYATDGKNTTG
jgi:hypothetical protein